MILSHFQFSSTVLVRCCPVTLITHATSVRRFGIALWEEMMIKTLLVVTVAALLGSAQQVSAYYDDREYEGGKEGEKGDPGMRWVRCTKD